MKSISPLKAKKRVNKLSKVVQRATRLTLSKFQFENLCTRLHFPLTPQGQGVQGGAMFTWAGMLRVVQGRWFRNGCRVQAATVALHGAIP